MLSSLLVCSGVFCSPVFGIEIPTKEITKPAPPEGSAAQVQKKKNAEASSIAWLGVAGGSMPDILAQHLEVEKGLVIDHVVPDSPAGNANFKEKDVILEVGDKKVGSQSELRNVIKSKAPGESLEITIVRSGKKIKQKVVLGERPEPKRDLAARGPDSIFKELRKMKMKSFFGKGSELQDEEIEKLMKQIAEKNWSKEPFKLKQAFESSGGDFKFSFGENNVKNGMTQKITISDKSGKLSLIEDEKGESVRAEDLEGNLIFEGPMNTEEERALIPEDIMKRVGKLK